MAKKNKMYSNDPESVKNSPKQKKIRRKKINDKGSLIAGGTILGLLGLGATGAIVGHKGMMDTRNKINVLKREKEYYNSKRSKMMQKPRRVDVQSPDMN